MALDLDSISGVVQIFIGGGYEGYLSDFRFSRPRSTNQIGVSNGRNVVAVGIEKPTVSFSRPVLKTSKGTSAPIEILDGPVDIDVVLPGSDQQWRLPGFRRNNMDFNHSPDSGSSTESYSGVCGKPVRVK